MEKWKTLQHGQATVDEWISCRLETFGECNNAGMNTLKEEVFKFIVLKSRSQQETYSFVKLQTEGYCPQAWPSLTGMDPKRFSSTKNGVYSLLMSWHSH